MLNTAWLENYVCSLRVCKVCARSKDGQLLLEHTELGSRSCVASNTVFAGCRGRGGGDVSQPFTWTCLPPREEERKILDESIGAHTRSAGGHPAQPQRLHTALGRGPGAGWSPPGQVAACLGGAGRNDRRGGLEQDCTPFWWPPSADAWAEASWALSVTSPRRAPPC